MKELLLAGYELLTVLLPGAAWFAMQRGQLRRAGNASPALTL